MSTVIRLPEDREGACMAAFVRSSWRQALPSDHLIAAEDAAGSSRRATGPKRQQLDGTETFGDTVLISRHGRKLEAQRSVHKRGRSQ